MIYHHALFPKRAWESHEAGAFLRNQQSLLLPMALEVEQALHREVATVPVLSPHTLQHTKRLYRPDDTYLGSILNLTEAIEEASEHPRITSIEFSLAELTVRAINQQLPYIRAGLQWDYVYERD